jgi:hypothetical protein
MNIAESQRAGLESTFRLIASRESTKTVMTSMPSSHTNGFHGITQSDDSDDSDDKQDLVASVASVASSEVMTPKPLQTLSGITVITDLQEEKPASNAPRRKQLTMDLNAA